MALLHCFDRVARVRAQSNNRLRAPADRGALKVGEKDIPNVRLRELGHGLEEWGIQDLVERFLGHLLILVNGGCTACHGRASGKAEPRQTCWLEAKTLRRAHTQLQSKRSRTTTTAKPKPTARHRPGTRVLSIESLVCRLVLRRGS